ncbi:Ribonucleoprotein PTB-binding 2 [Bagarius yarrelli]|uniref:Ribonucleoprotein PTB-binding 1 n=1 Tax=Bagarius yarrelli TaxID=175774 RepID=A0A556VYM8_BAGYA|nr:Ribonucleoprotein PTB-binding 2 [Bagarius yarrelli]
MAAASSMQPPTAPAVKRPNSPVTDSDSPESRPEEDGVSEDTILRDMAELEPEEIERRLEKTRRELSNRRKIVIKNLPQDASNQEVHDILREYELKYCFVDRNKGTAFVTLLNGDQAQDAIHSLHQTSVRGRDISVQLQPTDSLLCVTNLPYTFTGTQFQELVRSYGNIERCFLVYSELTGHSKGYGFVEYMKKDSASRARSELLGKVQGDRFLMVQWSDVNQLSTAQHVHSKCLCVERLPVDFESSEELAHIFSEHYKPVFCQLAQDEGSAVRGFAVVEYETAEQAEAVLLEMDRHLIQGQEIRLSLCSPGTSGRSTLAALIAAQGVNVMLGNGLILQNLLHMHMAQQQLLHIKDKHITNAGGFGAGHAQMSPSDQNGALAPDRQPAVSTHRQTHGFSSGSSGAALNSTEIADHNNTASESCTLTELEVVKPPMVSPLSLNGAAPPILPAYSALPIMPGFIAPTHAHTHTPSTITHSAQSVTDWSQYYYARGQKREYPTLAVQEVTSEGPYVGQHSQGLGGQYADYFKKKRI